MIMSLFFILQSVLENVKIGHVSGSQSTTQSEAKDLETAKWPMNTAAFFPAGPEEATVSFTRLYRLTRATSILDFIRVALPHCPSLVTPTVNNAALWEALLDELKWASDRLDTDPTIAGNSAYNFENRPPPFVSIRQIEILVQTVVSTFTQSLRQNIQSSALMRYTRRVHDVLLKVLVDLKKRPPRSDLDTWGFVVAGIALSIVTTLPKNHTQRPTIPHPVLLAYAELNSQGGLSLACIRSSPDLASRWRNVAMRRAT
ncbi:hypothetical protein MVEN_02598000 [Mycena venus]|uniref:Uncharacterized protein n=1 Tax=Mycena venus TaxID=2733690 RepID=A0A8H6WT43_9AGAR|nr:hypothetical protein MVEN_02598000 [Mycena venus]